MLCSYVHARLGQCQQPGKGAYALCTYHQRAQDDTFRHDEYYHEKIVRGLLSPTEDYMTETEVTTLFRGRARHDGRRLDQWTKL